MMNITMLGTGLMGTPMAARLCAVPGFNMTAWNRSAAKAAPLAALGATLAQSASDAVKTAQVIITMLQDGDAVQEVLFAQGTAAAAPKGALVIDMSSISPAQARDHAQRLIALGLIPLDAPVSGGTLGAESGNLAIMVGGSLEAFEAAQPIFAALGRATHVGAAGAGQLAKLANQMIVGITIGAVAEALILCERGGANPAKVREAIRGGFAESRVLEVHGQRMVQRDFAKRGSIAVQLKDMRNAIATAHSLHVDTPITQALETLYAAAAAQGYGELDQSGLFLQLAGESDPADAPT
jgi:3-hydroxyisobutyrate dehydrogenase-like beta-hydroxyacid dehydrogenase